MITEVVFADLSLFIQQALCSDLLDQDGVLANRFGNDSNHLCGAGVELVSDMGKQRDPLISGYIRSEKNEESESRQRVSAGAKNSVTSEVRPEIRSAHSTAEEIFSSVLDQLEGEVSPRIRQRWFQKIKVEQANEELVLLSVPSAFVRDYLQKSYGDSLNRIVRKQGLGPVRWKITVSESDNTSGSGNAIGTSAEASLNEESKTDVSLILKPDSTSESKPRFSTNNVSEKRRPAMAVAPAISASPIPAGIRRDLTLDRFVVGKSNQVAYSAVKDVLRSPGNSFNPLFLHGGSGLGKTHLLQALTRQFFIQGERRIRYVQCEKFVQLFVRALQQKKIPQFREDFRSLKVLVIDDVQMIAGKKNSQEELLETIDVINQSGGQVLLACDVPPRRCQFLHQHLKNRFSAGLVVRLDPPDLETRLSILERQSIRSGIQVPGEVLHFIADNIRTSVRELLGAFTRLEAQSDLTGEVIDLGLAQRCLEPMVRSGQRVITMDVIVESVARRWSIPPEEIQSRSRTRNTSMARNVAIYLAKILTNRSNLEIGAALGGRSHATASSAHRKIREKINEDEHLREEVNRLIRELRG
ncbi:MAG: chromosomal replication initiator protein DnaA [Planctomycetia bacterium]|nr:chromosomal replication initiator protein DnaA [Planctomycetia bacterium]